jgi:anti-sigma factor RsiW
MKHGITPVEWEHYLDGDSPPSESERIEAHLTACRWCWEFHQRLAAMNTQLSEAGERQCRAFSALSDEKLRQGLHRVYARIHATHTAVNSSPLQQRLSELEAVMSLFCGSQTALNALQTAAAHSPARSLKQMTREHWEPFLQRLSAIAHVLCGRTGARLVAESGRL